MMPNIEILMFFFRPEFQFTAMKDGTEQGKDKNSFPNWRSKSSF